MITAPTPMDRAETRPVGRSDAPLLAAVGASVVAVIVGAHLPAPARMLAAPWWALAIGFCLAEWTAVDVRLRREAFPLSLVAVPLVLGLFAVSPRALVAAQLLGTGAALLGRRRRLRTIALGLARAALVSALAAAVFRAVLAAHDPYGARAWLAALVAATAAVTAGAVLAATAADPGEQRGARRKLSAVAVSLAWTPAVASLGLAAVLLAHLRPVSVALLALPAAAGVLALRSYAAQGRGQAQVETLYEAMPRPDDASELDSVVRQLLISARRLLRAELAEILILPIDPRERPLRSSFGNGVERLLEPTELSSGERIALETARARGGLARTAAERGTGGLDAYASERGVKDGLLATLEGESGLLGVLLVGDRADGSATFGQEDEKLLRTFAGHATLLLENEQLEQSLAKLSDLEAKLRHQALHDALTGLPNRRLFHTRVREALDRAWAEGSEPVVLFVDLDGFKTINDELGHAAGDELLVAFAERLRGNVRPEELAARLGGDEFAVLLESGGKDVAEEVALRLIQAVRDPFSIHGRRLGIGLSIGIATSPGAQSVEELLANADLAMYAAKSDQAASYALYSERMRGSAKARQRLGRELEEALQRNQIAVHYQPIVDLRTGATAAFEALARWRRDGSDTVSAAEFLPAAEEGELIERIGQVVLRAACVQAQEWREASEPPRDLSVCVNLSPAELRNPRLCAEVAAALLESGLDARRLILEVTAESVAAGGARATMTELRRLGVRFALDGFGAGTTSLEQLCELPFQVVKIARPLVQAVGTSPVEERLVRAIVGLAGSLGMRVIAEGIESPEQADRLATLGCNLGQGFHFDPALAAAQATRRLEAPVHLRLLTADTA